MYATAITDENVRLPIRSSCRSDPVASPCAVYASAITDEECGVRYGDYRRKRPAADPIQSPVRVQCTLRRLLTKHPDCQTRGVLPFHIKCYCSGSIFLCSIYDIDTLNIATNALLCRSILPSTVTEACTPTDTTRRRGPRHHPTLRATSPPTSTAITEKPRTV